MIKDSLAVRTRKEAISEGLHKYWNGKECMAGHWGLRYTRTGACVECVASLNKKYSSSTYILAKQSRSRFMVECHLEDKPIIDRLVNALAASRKLMGS
jgi:hypothetical protein